MRLIDEVIDHAALNAEAAIGSDHRAWGAHHRNCVEIRKQYDALLAALEEIVTGNYSPESLNATGYGPGMIWEKTARRALASTGEQDASK